MHPAQSKLMTGICKQLSRFITGGRLFELFFIYFYLQISAVNYFLQYTQFA